MAAKFFLRFRPEMRRLICILIRPNDAHAQQIQKLKPFARKGVTALAIIPIVYAWVETDNPIIKKADVLYEETQVEHLYQYLIQHRNSNNAEILWRLCRALRNQSEITSDAQQRKELVYDAFEVIKKALTIDEKNFAVHKWYAIMLSKVGELEGTKQQLTNAYLVKEHFMKAIELNPTDATCIHLLGQWCFTVADLAWYERKIASVIYATPPSSSYDEALKYFLDAEKVDPGFYSTNLMMLGKTYLRMQDKQQALVYLQRAKDYPIKSSDDQKAHDEAVQLLKSV